MQYLPTQTVNWTPRIAFESQIDGSSYAWNNFDFWCLSARLLSSSGNAIDLFIDTATILN